MTQINRILQMLMILNTQKPLCSYNLSYNFGVSLRTIQRDIKILKELLKDKLYQYERGKYILQNDAQLYNHLQNIHQNDDIKQLFEFIALFDNKLLKFFNQKKFPIIKQIQKDISTHYYILEKPIESLKTIFLTKIKQAISQQRYANLSYKEIKLRDFKSIKPIKIVFAEGNWYLASMTNNYKSNYGFKFFRINFITNFTLLPNTFHQDLKAIDFIKNFQSLFQNYNTPTYEVKIKVSAQVSRHFRVKKHLKSQQIIKKKESGDLIITYQINNDMEIVPLIKKWLPHLKVLSPKTLDDKIKEEIQLYLT